MVYRLLAMNTDGTFLDHKGRVTKATKQAIEYAHKKKIAILLYSGREYSVVKRLAKALHPSCSLAAHNGAYIASDLDKPIFIQRIPEDCAFDITQFLEAFDCRIVLENESFSVSNKGRLPKTLIKKNIWQRTQKFLYSQYFVESLVEHLMEERISPLSIHVEFYKKEDREEALQALRNMFNEAAFHSKDHNQIQINSKGVSKWNSIMYAAERQGISRSEIAVIGAEADDAEAVQQAGIGIAMGNAHESVKAAADWITRTSDEEGIAYVIKELFRHQQRMAVEEMSKLD
ncbi:HAD family hydrolase [Bacillus xiapuensis]|uniref:HAD family hydrolase n=1 Tax=Bacillus xiapuensis TaxID=2014075 RepID=UPI000C249140|nr:HAD family hydrolase [Bacillus xiapuensis]